MIKHRIHNAHKQRILQALYVFQENYDIFSVLGKFFFALS